MKYPPVPQKILALKGGGHKSSPHKVSILLAIRGKFHHIGTGVLVGVSGVGVGFTGVGVGLDVTSGVGSGSKHTSCFG